MEKIIENEYNIKESEITKLVTRVKALMINSNKEILLAYLNNCYQFPGGHVEENENLNDALNREIMEETGIILNKLNFEPFLVSYRYFKDHPEVGKNRKNEIYYYVIEIDEKPNLHNVFYTKKEIDGNFELRYISLNKVENVLKENVLKFGDRKGIAKEMLEAIKIYKNNNQK